MKRIQNLTDEINKLTLKIEQEYPELYHHLDENPITLSCSDHPQINTDNLSEYLESLKALLEHHLENHPNKKA